MVGEQGEGKFSLEGGAEQVKWIIIIGKGRDSGDIEKGGKREADFTPPDTNRVEKKPRIENGKEEIEEVNFGKNRMMQRSPVKMEKKDKGGASEVERSEKEKKEKEEGSLQLILNLSREAKQKGGQLRKEMREGFQKVKKEIREEVRKEMRSQLEELDRICRERCRRMEQVVGGRLQAMQENDGRLRRKMEEILKESEKEKWKRTREAKENKDWRK